MKETTKAYLAGLVDGEGCITICESARRDHYGIKTSYPSFGPRFCIVNANKNLIESVLQDWALGSIKEVRYKNPRYKPTYVWETRRLREILKAIEYILPYLKLKRKQALLMIEYCKSRLLAPKGGHCRYAEREIEIVKLIKALNHEDSFMIDKSNGETSRAMRAYLASLIDGEGTIRINKASPSGGMSPQLYITNTSEKLLRYIGNSGPWRIHEHTHQNNHWRKAYRLILERQIEIIKVLKNISPYLRLKRKQADLMTEYCKHRLNQVRNMPYTECDREIPQLIRELNGRS